MIVEQNKLEITVGELVTERPARARVFEGFGIDYCCGGKKPLAEAIRELRLDESAVLAALEAVDAEQSPEQADLSSLSMTALADHIEATHHAYLRAELPRLEFYVNKVANRHGPDKPHLVELARVFNAFKAELESHMQKEEQILFPMCRELDRADAPPVFHCGSVRNPIAVMFREHDDAGEALRQMRRLTDDYTAPPDACNTFRAMFHSLEQLEQDMHRHIHKENSILFPKAVAAEAKLAG